ncbi:hypothetical protein IV38_GL001595 [Lactobacillus selangorensis]|uniref:DUF1648 domain-containing protein n=1 Tax=Lactobacillus selangorensis TaxID=81857 RepID=A0A0R2FHX7_9LACO|nr:hypothetical protein [Lactobacillus selangorensis]KRN28144.1 hypothetical protein IV38_GL001595 [Lactobacillus selangorensis]KRN30979.1 hypothetical protein IV40_GL001620 [Lactobacillus selangorensis]
MAKFKAGVRGLDIAASLFTLICYLLAPASIPVHLNNIGPQNEFGPKWMLFLSLLALCLFGELLIWFSKRRRKRLSAQGYPHLLQFEYGYLAVDALVFVVFVVTMIS